MSKIYGTINLNNEHFNDAKLKHVLKKSELSIFDELQEGYSFCVVLKDKTHQIRNHDEYILNNNEILIMGDLRIDNIASELKELNDENQQIDNMEMLYLGYKQFGIDFLKYIEGEFAIFIWDKVKNVCFLARDPFGLKSLFFLRDGNNLTFSSEIKTLEGSNEHQSLNRMYFIEYLYHKGTPPDELTPYQNVYRVEKGCYIQFTREDQIKKTYWKLSYRPIFYKSSNEYAEHFVDIFKSAIENQMKTPGNIAVMMSGGLDSTSIYGMGKIISSERVFPVSNVFDIFHEDDERKYIYSILDKYKEHKYKFIVSDHLWVLKDYHKVPRLDEPCVNTLTYSMVLESLKAAKDGGATVALTGYAGDQVFGYSPEYVSNKLRDLNIIGFFTEAKKLARFRNETLLYVIKNFGLKGLSSKFQKSSVLTNIANEQARNVERKKRKVNARVKHNLQYVHQSQGFQMTQIIAKSLGIEIRYPFLNKQVVEFIFNLPLEQKVNNATTKILLRNAMRNIVPNSILDQVGKASNDSLLFYGLKEEWDTVLKAIDNSLLAEMDIINVDRFKEQMLLYRHGELSKGMDYFAVLEAELWLKRTVGEVECLLPL